MTADSDQAVKLQKLNNGTIKVFCLLYFFLKLYDEKDGNWKKYSIFNIPPFKSLGSVFLLNIF